MRFFIQIITTAIIVFHVPAVLSADMLSVEDILENIQRTSPWQFQEIQAVLNVTRNESSNDFVVQRSIIANETIISVQDSVDNLIRLRFADNTVNIQADGRRVFTLEGNMKFLDFLSSDFSYYDVLSSRSFESGYESIEIDSGIRNGESVYEVSGINRDAENYSLLQYHSRVLFIDADTGLLIEDIAYNREGYPIRRLLYSDYRPVSEHTDLEFPHRIEAENLHRQYSRSSLIIEYPADLFPPEDDSDVMLIDTEQQVSLQHP
ncbi:outer membrane lipoprotein-sorting protein [Spirochaeta dissipatitropha]